MDGGLYRRIAEVDWPGIRVPRDRAAVRDEHGHGSLASLGRPIAAGIGAGAGGAGGREERIGALAILAHAGDGHVVEAHRMPCRGLGPARASFVAAAEIEVDSDRSAGNAAACSDQAGIGTGEIAALNARSGPLMPAIGDGFVGRGLADRAGDRLDGHRAIGRGGIRR
ncbi:hypothetical protein QU38_02585, partial [Staphylococcus aureus]